MLPVAAHGCMLAALAAVAHACIDAVRKGASSRIPSPALVALPALLVALIASCVAAAWSHHAQPLACEHPWHLAAVTVASSSLLLFSKFLYQRALAIAPLSLTIPFLSFSPALMVLIAFLFLGEQPSPMGIVGVCIITLGGYLLSLGGGGPRKTVSKSGGGSGTSSSSKPASLIPASLNGQPALDPDDKAIKAAASKRTAGQQLVETVTILAEAVGGGGGGGGGGLTSGGGPGGGAAGLNVRSRSLNTLWSHGSDPEDPLLMGPGPPNGTHAALMAQPTPQRPQHAAFVLPPAGVHDVTLAAGRASGSGTAGDAWVTGPWAAARKNAAVLPPSLAQQTAPDSGNAPSNGGSSGAGSLLERPPARPGLQRQVSYARVAGPEAGSGGTGCGCAAPLAGQGQYTAVQGQGQFAALAQQPGSLLMIGVACLWSVTASLDKLGVQYAPSIGVYIVSQTACIAVLSNVSLALTSPLSFSFLRTHFGTLLLISVLELAAVALFFEALKHVFVSYVVAIKRCNILLSVLAGGFFFRESVLSRLPCIVLMLSGVAMIVLEPNTADLHAHHT